MRKQIIPVILFLLCTTGHAQALTISSIDGTWTDTTGGKNVTYPEDIYSPYGNTQENQVRWGTTTGYGQSGLGFTGATPPPAAFDFDDVFEIGQLQHYNNPIASGSAASEAFISVSLLFSDPAGFQPIFNFSFTINETPNSPGRPLSDDHITMHSPAASENFDYDGISYSFELIGFGNSYNTLISSFSSPENETNSTLLWGRITNMVPGSQPVPEPSTLLLFSTGMVGLAGYAGRKMTRMQSFSAFLA